MPKTNYLTQLEDGSYAAIVTRAQLKEMVQSGEVKEPKSNSRMSATLQVLGVVNYIINPDARKRDEIMPDPSERLVVVAQPAGRDLLGRQKIELDKVYAGKQVDEQTVVINQVRDAQMHYTFTTNKEGDPRAMTFTNNQVSVRQIGELDQWHRDVQAVKLPPEQGQGYRTASRYDAPAVEVPPGIPVSTRSIYR